MNDISPQIDATFRSGKFVIRGSRLFSYWVLLFVPAAMIQILVGGHTVTFVDLWLLIFAFTQLAHAAIKAPRNINKHYLVMYILAFTAYLFVNCYGFAYAADKAGVFKELAKWLEIMLISISVMLYAGNLRRFRNIYWSMFFILVGVCIYHMAENILDGHLFQRMYVNVDWAIALSLPFLGLRWMRLLYVFVFAPCLILSYSRLSWASTSLIAVASVVLMKGINLMRRRVVIVLTMTVMVWIIVSIAVPRFASIIAQRVLVTFNTSMDQSAFTRGAMIKAGIMDFIQHPLLGVGAGNFKNYVILHQANIIYFWLSPDALPNSPHSVVVQIAAELGTPGLIAMSFVLFAVLVGVKRGYKLARSYRPIAQYSMGMVLFVIPLLVTLVASNVGDTDRVIWGIYFGLAMAMFRLHKCYSPKRRHWRLDSTALNQIGNYSTRAELPSAKSRDDGY